MIAAHRDRAVPLRTTGVAIDNLDERGDRAAIAMPGITMPVITVAVMMAARRIPMFGANAGARLKNN